MGKEFIFKIHKSYRLVVAVCDLELVGKKIDEGEKQLDLSTNFFNGEKIDLKNLKYLVKKLEREDATFFIVGNRSVELFKELEIIDEEGIKTLSGVRFALALL